MKFTLSWLKDHLDTNASLEEISETLTAIGLEVESVDDPAGKFAPFRVAYVEKAEQHPDADRLKVCTVNTGEEKVQVVCGAPNARTGMKGVFAPEGSYVPGIDMWLKKTKIRGVESCGMLVSEREMEISDDHEGIIEVGGDVELGTSFAALYGLDDPVIEIGLTPNRADCAGVRGIARDLAAAGLGTLKPLEESGVKEAFKSPIAVHFKFDKGEEDACPLFIGRYIKNVKNGPSPDWMQKRLKAIGLRPISALVDITNYLSYDLCRPLHVFDADKLKGDLVLKISKGGERFTGLDANEHELSAGMTMICDDSGLINLAGIMGGESTGCDENTQNVFLECAYFDPARTARTGRALGVMSDARYRFERGIDPAFTIEGAEIATRMIIALCGGEAGAIVRTGEVPDWKREITLDPAFVRTLTGVDIAPDEQKNILEALGFTVSGDRHLTVTPPSWRGDIDGRADLAEEIVRIYGYDKIETLSLNKDSPVTQPAEKPLNAHIRHARSTLAARGMNECVSWSFMPAELAARFDRKQQKACALTLKNPISSALDRMRPSIVPNLIQAAMQNRDRGYPDNALFEVGPVFVSSRHDGQLITAAGVRSGHEGPRHWSDDETHRQADAMDVKADALAVLEECGAPCANAQITRDAPDYYHPGRSGVIRLGKNVMACFGALHPAVMEMLDCRETIAAFEVFLETIPEARKKGGTARPLLKLPPFQPVARDFAFIVDEKTEAADLVAAARSADKDLVWHIEIFDIYQGKGIDDGKKSVAMNVTLQPWEKTLTEADLEALSSRIIETVAQKTGGTLRS